MAATASVSINLSTAHQTIDGFGANINPVGHWREGGLIPVMDRLIDDLGATIFRLDPYGFCTWIDPAGTGDRSLLNEENYARVYRSAPFRDAWGMARYLNSRGLEPLLNVSGVAPPWMCGPDGKTLTDYETYVDLLSSLARWAWEEEGIRFSLFGPFNETDLGPPEGPFLDPAGAAKVLALLAQGFDAAGLGDVRFVAVDEAKYSLDYLTALADMPGLREKIGVAGMHCYFDGPLTAVHDFLHERGLAWRYWFTEYGDLDETGEREWETAAASTRRLLTALLAGARAALVWDAYDNFHGHDDSWSLYGLLRVGIRAYTPKKRYYAAKQVYRFVPPGSVRVETGLEGEHMVAAAFRLPDDGLTFVALNEGTEATRIELRAVGSSPAGRHAYLYQTTRQDDCALTYAFPWGDRLTLTLPGESIVTLTTVDR